MANRRLSVVSPQDTLATPEIASIVSALLTTAEASSLVSVGERTLWRWSRSGIAPAPIKIGPTAVRYRRDELLEWIASGCPRVDRKGAK